MEPDIFGIEIDENTTLLPPKLDGRGGRREGAGRKKGYSPIEAGSTTTVMGPNGVPMSEATLRAVRKADAQADKMEWDAKNAELKYKIESKEYLSRTAFREAVATLLAEVASSCRSIPDILERKHHLKPEVLAEVEKSIDETLDSLADSLELFFDKNAAPHEQ